MDKGRRKFLKIAGASVLLLGGKPVAEAVAGEPSIPRHVDISEEGDTKWAMVIDTRKCREHEDCHDCELACHKVHNVPSVGNTKEEVKWIWKDSFENVFPEAHHEYRNKQLNHKPFLALCNHCDDPPCVWVCPTQATFKRGDGIVTMDMHRCIGCRFCIAACPYGSRSFNWRDPREYFKDGVPNPDYPTRTRGVVEKCNFCSERVALGQKPACVEACKHGALTFGNAKDPNSEVRKLLAENNWKVRKPSLGTGPEVYYII